jgi:hypothetical protein
MARAPSPAKLRAMAGFRRWDFKILLLLGTLACSGQDESKGGSRGFEGRRADTASPDEHPAPPALGEFIVVSPSATDTNAMATVVWPGDTIAASGLQGREAELVGRSGSVRRLRFGGAWSDGECVRLELPSPVSRGPDSGGAAFVPGQVLPAPAEPGAQLGARDSLAIVRAATALASTIRGDTSGRFTGLPFVVVSVWRVVFPSDTVAIATFRRTIPQESSPLEERSLVVVVRDASGDWSAIHTERGDGREETVVTPELLVAVVAGSQRNPLLLFERDHGDGRSIAMLGRDPAAGGDWRIRWVSRPVGC